MVKFIFVLSSYNENLCPCLILILGKRHLIFCSWDSCLAYDLYVAWVVILRAQSLQPCPTLCDPMDCSPTGSSVHGILQARILEWAAIPFSRGSSQSRDWTQVLQNCRQILYHLSHEGSPCASWLPLFFNISLFGCARSQLWHSGSSICLEACGIF